MTFSLCIVYVYSMLPDLDTMNSNIRNFLQLNFIIEKNFGKVYFYLRVQLDLILNLIKLM